MAWLLNMQVEDAVELEELVNIHRNLLSQGVKYLTTNTRLVHSQYSFWLSIGSRPIMISPLHPIDDIPTQTALTASSVCHVFLILQLAACLKWDA